MPLSNRTVQPINTGYKCWYTGAGNTLNQTSGLSKTLVAGTIYWAQVFIATNCTLTGVIFTTGATGGTDNWIGALYDNAGNLLANSSLSGIVAPAANTKKNFAFTAPVTVIGPGSYYIALQSNGTTANAMMFGNAVEGFVTNSTTGTFGTLPSITPGTSYTFNIGPHASTY